MQLPDTSSLEFLHKEWPVIKGAPFSFFGSVVIVSIAIWGLLWSHFRSRISKYRETVEHLERDKVRLKEELLQKPTIADVSPSKASISAENSGKIEANPIQTVDPVITVKPIIDASQHHHYPAPQIPAAKTPHVERKPNIILLGAKQFQTDQSVGCLSEVPNGKITGVKAGFRNQGTTDNSVTSFDYAKVHVIFSDSDNKEIFDVECCRWLGYDQDRIDIEPGSTRWIILAVPMRGKWYSFFVNRVNTWQGDYSETECRELPLGLIKVDITLIGNNGQCIKNAASFTLNDEGVSQIITPQ